MHLSYQYFISCGILYQIFLVVYGQRLCSKTSQPLTPTWSRSCVLLLSEGLVWKSHRLCRSDLPLAQGYRPANIREQWALAVSFALPNAESWGRRTWVTPSRCLVAQLQHSPSESFALHTLRLSYRRKKQCYHRTSKVRYIGRESLQTRSQRAIPVSTAGLAGRSAYLQSVTPPGCFAPPRSLTRAKPSRAPAQRRTRTFWNAPAQREAPSQLLPRGERGPTAGRKRAGSCILRGVSSTRCCSAGRLRNGSFLQSCDRRLAVSI